MDPTRQKRQEEISKALAFIQSSLDYPESEGDQDFVTHLVCNLLEEGNALFRDKKWKQAVQMFSEGVNVSSYAAGEEIQIPQFLLESLYVNRAAAFYNMGEYGQAVKDSDSALEVCKENSKALYRKALCLKALGKHKEAYNCTTDCLLITRLDERVNELAQELAVLLGLKIRKPYICAKDDALKTKCVTNGKVTTEVIKGSGGPLGNGMNPLSGLSPVSFPSIPSTLPSCCQPAVSSVPNMDTLEESELMGEDLDKLLDCFPAEQVQPEAALSVPSSTCTSTNTVPSVFPTPTPQLPPAFFNSAVSQLNSLDSFSGGEHSNTTATLDSLDDLLTPQGLDGLDNLSSGTEGGRAAPNIGLDTLDGLDSLDDILESTPSAAATQEVNESRTELDAGEKSLDDLLDELDSLEPACDLGGHGRDVPKSGVKAVDQLDSLDALDSFPSVRGVDAALPRVSLGGTGLDSDFSTAGIPGSRIAAAPVIRSPTYNYKEKNNQAPASLSNPLSSTHEFLQACSACFCQEGSGTDVHVHKPDLVHSCMKDILLCRRKAGRHSAWAKVRPFPAWNSFKGPFVLCKNLLSEGTCKFKEECTFAFNQLEIDVWTEERKGRLERNLLFETRPVKLDPVSSIIHLVQEHRGKFIFLCQECFNSKPTIISERSKENHTICSNLDAPHTFDANKCLAFVVKTHNVNYKKVRPLSVMCQLDLCHQMIRYRCQREDKCLYAHSAIELKTWRVQRDTGISHDEIVKISTSLNEKQETNSGKHKGNRLSSGGGGSKAKGGSGGAGTGKSLNMKMKFACAQCWRDHLISEPDKTLKYCTAKAKHMWTKERRVLLVRSLERSKWVQVRPLPHAKNPAHYDMCAQMLEKRKCNYNGNCTFAHSQEEKEMWMYMKNNNLWDMQQIYDMWLMLNGSSHQTDRPVVTQPAPEEKYIVMPTDYAEPMSGFHCRLCGRHSNSERQWQQHISTDKHKDRVFSCEGEDEALMWSYRFPGTCFQLCPRLDVGCPDGASCDYAHSPEELQEWLERRDFLRHKLAKAREDMLIMPDEFNFGKYNFLLQDTLF